MPAFKKKVYKKKRVVRKRKAVVRRRARIAISSNVARVVERLPVDASNDSEVAYLNTNTLSAYDRASATALNFRFYRLAYLKYTYMPNAGLATGTTGKIRRFYRVMNRQGWQPQGINESWFLQNNAKPIPFGSSTGKNVVVKYKPNTLAVLDPTGRTTADGTTVDALYLQSTVPQYNKWISTYVTTTTGGVDTNSLNDQVQFMGHIVYVAEPAGGATTPLIMDFTVEAVWEFKDPYIQPTGTPATVAWKQN